MPENTLLRYFFSSGSEVDPEDRFHLNRKTRTRRLKEISDILRKHHFLKGFTPEAFRAMLEDLGPSFVKIGQTLSTRSEILPKAYCDELAKLQMECDPLPFEAILEALDDIYGDAQGDVFDAIDPTPLGSASLAQVHKARLVTGEIVAVKIQRPGVKTTMAQDIDIMRMVARYAARFMKDEQMLDLRDVVEELWATFLEETDFQREAANLEEFARLNKGVAFIDCPKVHTELCGEYVLVMEYIEGPAIDDKEKLLAGGYDLEEIGIKLIDNYIKQVMEDGFFHADPHPGNVKIQDGKIVWIDMGMMGRLTERDKELIGKAIRGIAENDIGMIQEAVMALGEFKEKPDQSVLYEDISELMSKYGSLDMGEIDVAEVMMDLMEVMKENKIRMPHGLTMLARGLTNMEGVLADIAPQINMIEIASRHISESMWKDLDWKKELKHAGKNLYRSMHKAVEVPGLAADALHGLMKGQTRVNLDLHASNDLAQLLRRLVRNVVMGLWVMALLISSSIICTTNMSPKICGIPAIGAIGYLFAFAIVMYVLIKHILSK